MSRFPLSSEEDTFEIVQNSRTNGMLLIYKGHTFYHMHNKSRWYCSKWQKGCRAKVIATARGGMVSSTGEHDHLPPTIIRTTDGRVYHKF